MLCGLVIVKLLVNVGIYGWLTMLRKGGVGRRVARGLNDDIGEVRGRGSWRYAGRISTASRPSCI
jgi:hypothetical protein